LKQIATSNEELRDLLKETLTTGTGSVSAGVVGGGSSSAARGIMRKVAYDQKLEANMEEVFWSYRERIKAKLRVRKGKSWDIQDWQEHIPFDGYRTLQRSWSISAELFNALAEERVGDAKGILALWMMVQEEVARGSSWEKAWSFLPESVEDPCARTELGAVALEAFAMATEFQEGVEKIQALRTGKKEQYQQHQQRQWYPKKNDGAERKAPAGQQQQQQPGPATPGPGGAQPTQTTTPAAGRGRGRGHR
jgi:hypothetical protein